MSFAVDDQNNFTSHNLVKLKEVDEKYFLDKPALLSMGDNLSEALNIISNAFGVSLVNPRRIVPIFGIYLVIDFHLLVHIVEKRANGRERFALFAQKTLMNPVEVWKTLYSDGSYRYVYIGLFLDSKYHLAVVINIMQNGQILWNYMNCELRSLDKFRKGSLEYSALNEKKGDN